MKRVTSKRPRRGPRKQPSALVVNDDPSQLHLAAGVLRRDGFEVACCRGAEEALRVLAGRGPVDVIVTDLHMPGIDGWRFCRLLRAPEYQAFNHIPILVVSATFSGAEAEEVTADLGANAFLPAPYEPAALRRSAREILGGKRPRAATVVLIALADPRPLRRLRRAFEACGYAVHEASSGAEAEQVFRTCRPEIAVVGDPLPDMTAGQVVAGFKERGSRAVAIVITGEQTPAQALDLMRRGADEYIRAPFDPARVIDLVEKARRQRALLRIEELLEARAQALQASETRFRSLFESIPEAVFVYDDRGVILEINSPGARRLGLEAAEVVGKHVTGIVTAECAAKVFSRRSPVRRTGGSGFEATLVSRAGEEVAVEVSDRRIEFDGSPATLCVARDVGAKKELERQRADFLAMLTHDIRNPVTVILGCAALLKELGGLSLEQEEMANALEVNANTLLLLINNHLSLSALEAGRLLLEKKPMELNDVLSRVAMQYEAQVKHRRITLEVDLAAGLPGVIGDAVAIERIVSNLVHNALKFTPEGGRIVLASRARDGEVVVAVTDTGGGIAADVLPTVFERYKQVTVRESRGGTGLGLYIARALTELHGGRIEVETAGGRGTTFSVFLAPAMRVAA